MCVPLKKSWLRPCLRMTEGEGGGGGLSQLGEAKGSGDENVNVKKTM